MRRYHFADLLYLMQRLRDPKTGCPWDRAQNLNTIVPHTLEEVYEVVDAIERADMVNLKEELGDLLFQVVFYAQITDEQQQFAMDDIIHQLVAKLIYRHPHVFPEGTLESQGQPGDNTQGLDEQWEQLKAQKQAPMTSVLDGVPLALPALQRAYKLQKKAAKLGFDWPDCQGPKAKILEELAELEAAEADCQLEEAGDLLFSVVNLLRKMKLDPELALRAANTKFSRRFQYVERQAQAQMQDLSLAELEVHWQQAKRQSLLNE